MKKLLRFLPVALLVIGILMMSLGAGAQDKLTFRIVSHGGDGNPFWQIPIKGMNDACDMLGADCQWLADPVDSVDDMTGFWDDALAANPDGIGTSAPRAEAIQDGVNRANEAGIPVVTMNSLDANLEGKLVTHIGADEVLGGARNANAILDMADADGAEIGGVVCFIQEVGNVGLEQRCDGAAQVFGELGIEVVEQEISNDTGESASVMADFFEANPDTNVALLLGPNPSSSFNLMLSETGREAGSIYATTHDLSGEIFEMISDGALIQAIDQQPYLQGFNTIMWLYLNANFALGPGGNILTGPGVVDASNVDIVSALVSEGYR